MGKTILHFFDPILTARVGRPGVTVNENTGELEQTIDSPRIAPTGYYTVVDVGDNTHMYYRGIEYEPIGNGKNIQFKEDWELTTEEVFDYIATTTPLRQATSVADFANSVLLMASDLSLAITGQSIAVDGGLTMP